MESEFSTIRYLTVLLDILPVFRSCQMKDFRFRLLDLVCIGGADKSEMYWVDFEMELMEALGLVLELLDR